MDAPSLHTILLCVLNLLAGVGLFFFNAIKEDQKDIHAFIKNTRKKLDSHCEDFGLHGLVREKE